MRKGLILILASSLVGCITMFKKFHRVDDNKAKWYEEVSLILEPIQGRYLSAVYNQEFKESYKDTGFSLEGNLPVGFRKNKEIRIKFIRHERDFTDYLGRSVKIFIFKDGDNKEYQLYYFQDGRLEIISPERWDIFKKKKKNLS